MNSNITDLIEDLNEENFNRMIGEFMLMKSANKLEEAAPDKIIFSNINTKLKTTISMKTMEDRMQERINVLKDEIATLNEFFKNLDLEDKRHLQIMTTEGKRIDKAEAIIEEHTKLLNDEI